VCGATQIVESQRRLESAYQAEQPLPTMAMTSMSFQKPVCRCTLCLPMSLVVVVVPGRRLLVVVVVGCDDVVEQLLLLLGGEGGGGVGVMGGCVDGWVSEGVSAGVALLVVVVSSSSYAVSWVGSLHSSFSTQSCMPPSPLCPVTIRHVVVLPLCASPRRVLSQIVPCSVSLSQIVIADIGLEEIEVAVISINDLVTPDGDAKISADVSFELKLPETTETGVTGT
jgi:hypothetical protein